MKNLKKTLAVVLAFAMVLSMGFSAFAYTDVTAGTKVAEAVGILSNLGIFTGFEDGTFKPEDTVTRAQMAAIICRALGYEEQAQASTGTTIFNDVAASHWASGYVNVAQSLQIINGYGDGNFGPEDQVTYEQAIKMIVVALGYELEAQAKGGWSTGYLAVAAREGISKGANGVVGSPAARGTVAVLVYNSLEVPLMDQTSWTPAGNDDEYQKLNETILSRYLEIEKWEGVVSATPLTAAATSYKKTDAPKITIGSANEWKLVNKVLTLGNTNSTLSNINTSLVDDVNGFLGKKVVAYIGKNFDNTTGHKMLYAIAEQPGTNDTLVINAAQLVATDATANKIAYRNEGSTKIVDVALNPAIDGWKNFGTLANGTIAGADLTNTTAIATEDFAALLPNGGTIELIDSNASVAGYDKVILTKYDSQSVIEEVETDRGVVKFETNSNTDNLTRFDTEADDKLVIVYKDGEAASIEDIAAGDVVTVAQVRGNDIRVFYVSSAKVTGAVESWDNAADKKFVTVAGTDYKVSKLSTHYSDVTALKNKEGIFFLNVDGQVALADASAAKGNYGLILNVGKASMGKYAVEVMLADGTVASYKLANTLTWNTTAGTTGLAVAQALAGIMDGSANAAAASYDEDEAYTHTDTAAQLICEIKLNDNSEIKNLALVSVAAAQAANKYSEETMTLGAKSFDENTVMFALTQAATGNNKVDADDVNVGKAVELLADGETYTTVAYALENRVFTLALGYDLVASIPVDSDAIIVTDKRPVYYNDEEAVKIKGIQAGEEVSFILYNDNGFKSASVTDLTNLEVGDVILASAPNAEGVVADFQVIFSYNESTPASSTKASDVVAKDVYYHASAVDETEAASADFIWLTSANANVTTTDDNDTPGDATDDKFYIIMQRAANYTLVDYTEDAANPEIYGTNASKSLVGDFATEDTFVFVRVVDEKLVEVVAYRR